ncbi:MAG TPA: hypothetical protein VG890_17575 [Puia sp.]|nr:hypothetical protein [Puia sp.]
MLKTLSAVALIITISTGCQEPSLKYHGLEDDMVMPGKDSLLSDSIIYHRVRVDNAGNILPWYSSNLGESYDDALQRVWDFWKNMALDTNGIKYYMNHQVWRPGHDKRGIGGDQVMMALSSWDLYYNYSGDESVLDNMKYMADYYLAHSLSPSNAKWPDLPYPYNNKVESGIYDGDMILGPGFLQPDKAGSFGYELVHLYKKTGDRKYLDAAVKIANTMAANVQPGDNENSPWPFKVNAVTGEPGLIVDQVVWYEGMSKDINARNHNNKKSVYTSNWTATLELFDELITLHQGNSEAYKRAFDIALNWLKTYPAKTNKWGPFFEDVPRWSDTQINAITYAMYLLQHQNLDPDWKKTVKNIFQWVHKELDDDRYKQYGVIVTDEQTAYRQPGNSHSSREASVELMYWAATGDTTYVRNAIRELSWATYMVDSDGKNFYPTNDIWMTDGYGDYVKHYLRSMAAAPQLAPDNSDHLLSTSSIVKKIAYRPESITYTVFDSASTETFRLRSKPVKIRINGNILEEVRDDQSKGWVWQSLDRGGVLTIRHQGSDIEITK